MILGMTTGLLLAGATALADEGHFTSSETYRDGNGNICVDFGEVQVYLPSDWSGICQMAPEDDYVAFYQTKSRQLYTQEFGYAAGGWLFTVNYSETADFLEAPSYSVLGGSNDGYYYITYPTDVQGYVDDNEAMSEYSRMCEDLPWIEENIQTPYPDIVILDDSSEHILPQSSSEYLSLDDIDYLDAETLQMAINEIYARHHRKFILPEVQEYFNGCSWYDGYIEAADFDSSVMNHYEGTNITFLVERMNAVKADPGLINERYVVTHSETGDAYGMIIESGEGYFVVRQSDGSSIQFWYDSSELWDMGLSTADLYVGATVSVLYTLDSYQAVNILVF